MQHRPRLLIATLCTAVLLVALGIMLLWKPSRPEPPLVTANPAEIDYPEAPWIDRIPRTWGWAWRIRDKLLPRDTITLSSRLVELKGVTPDLLDHLPSATSGPWESDGFGLWILTEKQQERCAQQLSSSEAEVLQTLRLITADHMQSQARVGNPVALAKGGGFAGVAMDIYPRILPEGTDLIVTTTVTEFVTNHTPDTARAQDQVVVVSLHTNLTVGARVPIPRQGGLFLMRHESPDSGKPSMGLLISADVPSHKR